MHHFCAKSIENRITRAHSHTRFASDRLSALSSTGTLRCQARFDSSQLDDSHRLALVVRCRLAVAWLLGRQARKRRAEPLVQKALLLAVAHRVRQHHDAVRIKDHRNNIFLTNHRNAFGVDGANDDFSRKIFVTQVSDEFSKAKCDADPALAARAKQYFTDLNNVMADPDTALHLFWWLKQHDLSN